MLIQQRAGLCRWLRRRGHRGGGWGDWLWYRITRVSAKPHHHAADIDVIVDTTQHFEHDSVALCFDRRDRFIGFDFVDDIAAANLIAHVGHQADHIGTGGAPMRRARPWNPASRRAAINSAPGPKDSGDSSTHTTRWQ